MAEWLITCIQIFYGIVLVWLGLFLICGLVIVWNIAAHYRKPKKEFRLTQDEYIDLLDGDS